MDRTGGDFGDKKERRKKSKRSHFAEKKGGQEGVRKGKEQMRRGKRIKNENKKEEELGSWQKKGNCSKRIKRERTGSI